MDNDIGNSKNLNVTAIFFKSQLYPPYLKHQCCIISVAIFPSSFWSLFYHLRVDYGVHLTPSSANRTVKGVRYRTFESTLLFRGYKKRQTNNQLYHLLSFIFPSPFSYFFCILSFPKTNNPKKKKEQNPNFDIVLELEYKLCRRDF
ncbi:hypothetical protein ACH5RR_007156 [Cinchona calisaya]|uniref:Uncharacterized protein n=1 Tax=Cinchona calisaya TaxID=153742 RepID=A0ABD3AR35_9GENT